MGFSRDRAVVAALAALAAFVVLVVVQHPLRGGDLPPGEHFVSEYARGSTAGVQDLGSLLIFLGLLVAAPASVRRERRRGYRLVVLGLAVALFAITAVLIVLGIDSPGWGQRAFIAVGVAWQAPFLAEVRRSLPTTA